MQFTLMHCWGTIVILTREEFNFLVQVPAQQSPLSFEGSTAEVRHISREVVTNVEAINVGEQVHGQAVQEEEILSKDAQNCGVPVLGKSQLPGSVQHGPVQTLASSDAGLPATTPRESQNLRVQQSINQSPNVTTRNSPRTSRVDQTAAWAGTAETLEG